MSAPAHSPLNLADLGRPGQTAALLQAPSARGPELLHPLWLSRQLPEAGMLLQPPAAAVAVRHPDFAMSMLLHCSPAAPAWWWHCNGWNLLKANAELAECETVACRTLERVLQL